MRRPKGFQQLSLLVLTTVLTAVAAIAYCQRSSTFRPGAFGEEMSSTSRSLAGKDAVADFIANPPSRYSQIPLELRQVLARSILEKALPYPPGATHASVTLWDFLDNWMAASQIQTLVEVHREANNLGIWPAVSRIRKIYTGSSWGIQFSGPVEVLDTRVKQKDVCHDIDWIVRKDHGNTKHHWWRFIPGWDGVGYAHMGIGYDQEYHDLHFDSTNPATDRLGVGDTCNYGLARVIKHNVEIRMVDVTMTGAVRGFLLLERGHYIHQRILGVLDHDFNLGPALNRANWDYARKRFSDLKNQRDQINQEAHAIAATPDGFDTVQRLVSGSFAPFLDSLNDAMILFIQGIREDGLQNGYFSKDLGGMSLKFIKLLRSTNGIPNDKLGWPSGPTNIAGMSLPKSEKDEAESKNMAEYQKLLEFEELVQQKGSMVLKPSDTDWIISFFERIRKKSKS